MVFKDISEEAIQQELLYKIAEEQQRLQVLALFALASFPAPFL